MAGIDSILDETMRLFFSLCLLGHDGRCHYSVCLTYMESLITGKSPISIYDRRSQNSHEVKSHGVLLSERNSFVSSSKPRGPFTWK